VPRSERNRGGRPRPRLILSSNGRESSKTCVAVETFLRSVSVGDVHVPCPDCTTHWSLAARTCSGTLRTLCGPRPEVEALRISINFCSRAAAQPAYSHVRAAARQCKLSDLPPLQTGSLLSSEGLSSPPATRFSKPSRSRRCSQPPGALCAAPSHQLTVTR